MQKSLWVSSGLWWPSRFSRQKSSAILRPRLNKIISSTRITLLRWIGIEKHVPIVLSVSQHPLIAFFCYISLFVAHKTDLPYSMHYLNHLYQRLSSSCYAEMIEVLLMMEYRHIMIVFSQTGPKGFLSWKDWVYICPLRKEKKRKEKKRKKETNFILETKFTFFVSSGWLVADV